MNRNERRRRRKLAQKTATPLGGGDKDGSLQAAMAHHRAGNLPEAVNLYKKIVRADPSCIPALNNLGVALKAQGELADAVACYRRAIEMDPGHASAHSNLANVLYDLGNVDEAYISYRRAIECNPTDADAHYNFGVALKDQGRTDEAIPRFRRALEIRPSFFSAKWNALLTLPVLYESKDDIEYHRARWERGIGEIERSVDLNTKEGIAGALKAITASTNFFLHYQGRNDRELQERYGTLLHRIAAAAYPDLVRPLAKSRPDGKRKIRVGFASRHLYGHTIYKLFGRWVTGLDKAVFETHVFYTGNKYDHATETLTMGADHFHGRLHSNPAAIAAIRAAGLDALVFLDIGMDPNMQLLAALRLAPVQCSTWGHPITSGLPTMDYFLTSDLMEPADGDRHYSETLIRLPNISVCYEPPETPTPAGSHADGANPVGDVAFLCSQNLFKILPDFDDICARIAKAVANSRFWFIQHNAPNVTEKFVKRLSRAFDGHSLDFGRRCTLHPKMSQPEFLALTARADIVLDTIGWSGGNTTLETVIFDKPVVTLPGPMMRSRHTTAILGMMGIDETIARNVDEYIAIAIRLAEDADWRGRIIDRTRTGKHKVYEDQQAIRGLEAFLSQVCA